MPDPIFSPDFQALSDSERIKWLYRWIENQERVLAKLHSDAQLLHERLKQVEGKA